jgi:hypothetical protein
VCTWTKKVINTRVDLTALTAWRPTNHRLSCLHLPEQQPIKREPIKQKKPVVFVVPVN